MPKISQLPSVSSLGLTDVIPVVQSGTTYGVTAGNLNSATPYGSFSFTGSQVVGIVSASVSMSTTTFSSNITLSNNTRLNVTNAGKYLINGKILPSGSAVTFYGWLRVNGTTDVALSTFAGQPDNQVSPYRQVNFGQIVSLAANDYIELFVSGGVAGFGLATVNNASAVFPTASAVTFNIHQVN
jgi:hypothetical protein